MADLSLSEEARDLWEPALPHLSQALAGSEAAFLDALESAGRGAGLTQKMPVTDLLDAYSRWSEIVREALEGGDRLIAAGPALQHHPRLDLIAARHPGALSVQQHRAAAPPCGRVVAPRRRQRRDQAE